MIGKTVQRLFAKNYQNDYLQKSWSERQFVKKSQSEQEFAKKFVGTRICEKGHS